MDKFKLVFTEKTPKEQYMELYKLSVGSVFKVQSDYETVMQRIEDYKPNGGTFEVFPINPGTSLFTMYGASHCVVVENQLDTLRVKDSILIFGNSAQVTNGVLCVFNSDVADATLKL